MRIFNNLTRWFNRLIYSFTRTKGPKKNVEQVTKTIKFDNSNPAETTNQEIQNLLKTIELLKRKNSEQKFLYQVRIKNTIKVEEPLVLISQIQRSGGTLLSQLFDAHPECHAHPSELYIGHPDKTVWPVLNLNDDKNTWFDILFESSVVKLYQKGYKKYSKVVDTDNDIFPFIFLVNLQREIFNKCVEELGHPKSFRDIFNCYMTSYFNAWLDNQNLYNTPKKIITGFVPRMNMDEENIRRFFEVYPDGRLISMIRDPKDWYTSARAHREDLYGDIEKAIQLWKTSTNSTINNKKRYGNLVYVLRYEDLVQNTKIVMQSLAEYLNIEFNDILLIPTFNSFLIKADSSYDVHNYGIIKDPLGRYKTILNNHEIEFIDSQTLDLYEAIKDYTN